MFLKINTTIIPKNQSGQISPTAAPVCHGLDDHRRGAAGKTIIFSPLKRGRCVYTEIVPNACKATLQAIIRSKVDPSSAIRTGGWPGYGDLVGMGFDKHFRVNHGNNGLVRGCRHVSGIESFWSYASTGWLSFTECARASSSCI
jgi:transposase-like protein